MEERLENNNGKCFDKKRCGLIQIFKNFWSPFITRLNPDDSKLFVWAGMCLQQALQTPRSPGWGPGGERGVGAPAALGGSRTPLLLQCPKCPRPNAAGQFCTPGTCLQSLASLSQAKGEASNRGTILKTM